MGRQAWSGSLAFALALAVVASPPAPAHARQAGAANPPVRSGPDVRLETAWGFGGLTVAGALNPLRVSLVVPAGSGVQHVTLTVRVTRKSLVSGRRAITEYRYPLTVPERAGATVWLAIPQDGPAGTVEAEVQAAPGPQGAAGAASGSASISLRVSAESVARGCLAVVLSPERSGWEWLSAWQAAGGAPCPLRVVYVVHPLDLPPMAEAWDAVSLLAVDPAFPLERAAPVQIEALLRYASSGRPVILPRNAPARWSAGPARTLVAPGELARWPRVTRWSPDEAAGKGGPSSVQAALVAGRLGLVAASSTTRLPSGVSQGAAGEPWGSGVDPFRKDLADHLGSRPVSLPPRWVALASAVAYGAAMWGWLRAYGRWRSDRWILAGGGLVVAALAAGSWAGRLAVREVTAPGGLLLVRPAPDMAAAQSAAGYQAPGDAPLHGADTAGVQLLLAATGVRPGTWEIRSLPGGPELFPLPPWPEELPGGVVGLVAEHCAGDEGGPSGWRLSLMPDRSPSDGKAGGDGDRAQGPPSSWVLPLAVEVSPGWVLAPDNVAGRMALVSVGGAVPAGLGEVEWDAWRLRPGPASRRLDAQEAHRLPLDAGTLETRLAELLSNPVSGERDLQDLVAAAARWGARLAATREDGGTRPRYVLLAGRSLRPIARVRFETGPWQDVTPHVLAVAALSAGLLGGDGL
ncbi:MAG: hypothetical protein IMX02_10810 [Limnochordaceae bacterium]|nr:hypothetical protein [Limnochordaceae bacterium]